MSFGRKLYLFLLDSVQTIILAGAIFLIIHAFILRTFQVTGLSMFPNFHDQELVLTNIIGLHFAPLKRGEVIVFKAPTDEERDYIKRIVGLPGETVEVRGGSIYINGKKFDESNYLNSDVKTYPGSFAREGEPVTVPEGQYFVLGDNRSNSSDSREWGAVKQDAVIGRSFIVFWPVNAFRVVNNPINP